MRRFRFGIGHLLVVILYFGIGFAALKNASPFWASLTFSLSLLAVSVALAMALTSRGKSRPSWAGFAAAGWACTIIWLATPGTTGFVNGPPPMLLTHVLETYIDSMNPQAAQGGRPFVDYTYVVHSLEIMLFGLVGAILSGWASVVRERTADARGSTESAPMRPRDSGQ
jgi:hypothetical protein